MSAPALEAEENDRGKQSDYKLRAPQGISALASIERKMRGPAESIPLAELGHAYRNRRPDKAMATLRKKRIITPRDSLLNLEGSALRWKRWDKFIDGIFLVGSRIGLEAVLPPREIAGSTNAEYRYYPTWMFRQFRDKKDPDNTEHLGDVICFGTHKDCVLYFLFEIVDEETDSGKKVETSTPCPEILRLWTAWLMSLLTGMEYGVSVMGEVAKMHEEDAFKKGCMIQ